MRHGVFLRRIHLSEAPGGAGGHKPRVPAKRLFSSRLDQDFSFGLTQKDVVGLAVPIANAALGLCPPIPERIGHRSESAAAGSFKQPSDVDAGEISQLAESEGNVLYNQLLIAASLGRLQLVSGDIFDRSGLDLGKLERDAEKGKAENSFGLQRLIGIGRNKNQLVFQSAVLITEIERGWSGGW